MALSDPGSHTNCTGATVMADDEIIGIAGLAGFVGTVVGRRRKTR